jgi:hypothetical protein
MRADQPERMRSFCAADKRPSIAGRLREAVPLSEPPAIDKRPSIAGRLREAVPLSEPPAIDKRPLNRRAAERGGASFRAAGD